MDPLLLELITIVVGMTIYFLPAIVANLRKATHEISIFWLNFFLGWTVICWIVLLVWTVAETDPQLIPEKLKTSFLGRYIVDKIDGIFRFVPDDKSKGRVQFRRTDTDMGLSD